MNRIKYSVFLLLAACLAHVPQAFAAKSYRELWGGAVLKAGAFRVEGHTLALPPGDWLVVEHEDFKGMPSDIPAQGSADSYAIYLAQLDGRKLIAAASFKFGRHPNYSGGTWTNSPCEKRDPLFKDSFASDPKHPECLLLDYATEVLSDESAWMKRSIRRWGKGMIEKEALNRPPVFLKSTYSKYQSDYYLVVSYWINPEYLGGFPPVKDTRWNVNDWYIDNVDKSPERRAYVDELIKWSLAGATSYRQSMSADGVGAPLPPLPRAVPVAPKQQGPATATPG
jgi:hypothetical protein